MVPDIEGLDDVGYHTSDTVMRVDELPERLLILGGGYVAAEFAHVFGSLRQPGDVVNRSPRLLRAQDDEISGGSPSSRSASGTCGWPPRWPRSSRTTAGVRAHLSDGSAVEADLLLVATGRRSNADGLDLDRTGVEVDDDGVVVVDEHQHTSVDGIWALGDVANHLQLKHVSNHEARVVQHNLLHLDDPACWAAPATTSSRARCSPARRSPASASPNGTPSSRACGT